MQQGGDRKSENFNTEISVLISQPEAAAMLNVSTDSVQFAKKVLDQGSEELIRKVDAGEIGYSKEEIAEILSVSKRMVSNYLGDIDKQIREDRKETIRSMYLQCYTAEEIAEKIGVSKQTMSEEIALCTEMEMTSKTGQTANFQDDFDPPIYNRFSYGKVTNTH